MNKKRKCSTPRWWAERIMRKVDNLTASKWTDDRPFSRMQISATVSLLAQGESLGVAIPKSRLQGALRRLNVSMNSISQSLASTTSGPAPLVFGPAIEYRIEFSSQRPSQNRWLLRGSLESTVILHVHCHHRRRQRSGANRAWPER